MSWNHRVVQHEHEGESFFQVHEVYYDESGKPTSYTENAVAPGGETLEVLAAELELFRAAIALPVLQAADFPDPPALMGSWRRVQDRWESSALRFEDVQIDVRSVMRGGLVSKGDSVTADATQPAGFFTEVTCRHVPTGLSATEARLSPSVAKEAAMAALSVKVRFHSASLPDSAR